LAYVNPGQLFFILGCAACRLSCLPPELIGEGLGHVSGRGQLRFLL
jgi:hypothetical protein